MNALLTSPSIGPSSSRPRDRTSAQVSGAATSPSTAIARPGTSLHGCTSTCTTEAPSASSRSTQAAPIPDAAPVTTITRPANRTM
jgi:hypothetical protein